MLSSKALLVLFLVVIGTTYSFRRQSAAVRGKLTCAGVPASNILVKLFDQDDG